MQPYVREVTVCSLCPTNNVSLVGTPLFSREADASISLRAARNRISGIATAWAGTETIPELSVTPRSTAFRHRGQFIMPQAISTKCSVS